MNIVLSARNVSKLEQIKGIFEITPFQVLSLSDAQIAGDAVEDSDMLEENAEKKVFFARENGAKSWVMADDTGLFISALGGLPGIRLQGGAEENAISHRGMAFRKVRDFLVSSALSH